MNGNPAEQIVNELFPYFEALETRSLAILQLLKDKGLTTDEQFAPYLEQAGNASNVKWLAARVRIERLVASALKEQRDSGKTEETRPEPESGKKPSESNEEKSGEKSDVKASQPETTDSAKKPADNTTRNPPDNDADKLEKQASQEVSGSDAAERPEKREKDASSASAGKQPAKETSEKK